jgi:hypothetical protein
MLGALCLQMARALQPARRGKNALHPCRRPRRARDATTPENLSALREYVEAGIVGQVS